MLTGREVAAAACRSVGMTLGQVLAGGKSTDVCRARSAAAWALRERWRTDPTGYSVIGTLLSLHDSASAKYAYQRALKLRESDPLFRAATDRVLQRVRQA